MTKAEILKQLIEINVNSANGTLQAVRKTIGPMIGFMFEQVNLSDKTEEATAKVVGIFLSASFYLLVLSGCVAITFG